MYGYQWVNWEKYTQDSNSRQYNKSYINQIEEVINLIKKNPDSRPLDFFCIFPIFRNEDICCSVGY